MTDRWVRWAAAAVVAVVAVVAGGGCHGKHGDGSTIGDEKECPEAEARLGYRACVHAIPDDDTFQGVTVASVTVDALRVGKYLVPATSDAPLPPAFLDVNAFPLHYDFLVTAFPDWYSGLTTDQYEDLILYPDTRQYYAGTVSLYVDGDGFYYGFTVWDDPADPTSTITEDDVTKAYDQLKDRFEIGQLEWVPNSLAQQEASKDWTDAPFPMHDPADVDYEVYNAGEGYGYLRLYTLDDFAAATEAASFGYQDILVIEEAPEDITRVVSGIVTGTRQGTLSHLNVRSSVRGTPNCYVKDPLTTLAAYKDQLVHFTCGDETWSAEAATVDQATAWWESIRPDPVTICAPDTSTTELAELHELPTDTPEDRETNLCRYGAKGANLATLYDGRVPDEYQLTGFLIPFSYYESFIHSGTWTVDLGDGLGATTHTFADTLEAWHQDPTFLTDAAVRQQRLDAMRTAFYAAPVDPADLKAIEDRIVEVFGSDLHTVRLRSSSNAEDGLLFSGAGLYESHSACVADELDGDSMGPSRCDPDKPDERTLSDALHLVWGSLWRMQAWDERDWYGIDQNQVAMGILVDDRFADEQANVVAFSGNPSSAGDPRYLVNAQCCELEVVLPDPGIYPEKELLTVDESGVTKIERVSQSSETDLVLTDDQLRELGGVFEDITEVYPQDDVVPEGHDVLWDTEWKFDSAGQLYIKQIRPFLR